MNPSKPPQTQPEQPTHGTGPQIPGTPAPSDWDRKQQTDREAHAGTLRILEKGLTPTRPGNLIRLPDVEARTGLKKSSVYAGMKARTFPAHVRLSARAVAWRESDIDRWISERVTTGGSHD